MTVPSCTGLCAAGYFGSTSGLTTANCSGLCTAGYMCPSGSINATAVKCPPGQYSLPGAGVCTPCPPGVYGAVSGLTNASCTAMCAPGYYGATQGQTNATCSGPCPGGLKSPSLLTFPLTSVIVTFTTWLTFIACVWPMSVCSWLLLCRWVGVAD